MDIQATLNEWENAPEMQCSLCGAVFKGGHECDYERLKEMNKELVSLNLWQARRLPDPQRKQFAYDELDKITKQQHERL